jgi:putative membrane protein
MKQRLLVGIAVAAMLVAGGALAQTSNDATGTTTQAGTSAAAMPQITEASEFVKQAAAGGEYEIRSSKLALKQSKSEDVKRIAQRLIDDHTKAGKALKATVKEAGVKAKIPEKLDQKHQTMMDELKKAKGTAADFDKIYLDQQLSAHQDAIALFSGYAESGDNDKLKSFAEATLPTLQEHQQMVTSALAGMPSQ